MLATVRPLETVRTAVAAGSWNGACAETKRTALDPATAGPTTETDCETRVAGVVTPVSDRLPATKRSEPLN